MNVTAALTRHDLIAVSAHGQRCSCGERFSRIVEHFADLALEAFEPDPVITAEDMARTRRVLLELADENDRLAEELDATGLTSFVDRSEWLIGRWSRERRAVWVKHWAALGVADPEPSWVAPVRRHRAPQFTPAQLRIAVECEARREGEAA